jgi:hypothetical protein
MPGVVGWFADVNPVTVAVDATRALTIGHGDALAPALGTLAWLVGLLAVFVPLAVRTFRPARSAPDLIRATGGRTRCPRGRAG